MRRFVFAWLVAIAAVDAYGENAPLLTTTVQHGYVFDQPRILTQQRLFGLAHGISLLADRCFDQLAHGEEVREAYAAWHQQQAKTIALAQEELAQYYFGARAGEAAWSDIVVALGLKNELSLKLDASKLKAACATLPQALARYHSDLTAQFHLQAQLNRLTVAAETEAQEETCKGLLPADAASVLDAGIQQWHQAYSETVAQAHQTVEQRWQEVKLEGTLDQWLKQARNSGRHKATVDHCAELSAWLATPAADPDTPFKQKP